MHSIRYIYELAINVYLKRNATLNSQSLILEMVVTLSIVLLMPNIPMFHVKHRDVFLVY